MTSAAGRGDARQVAALILAAGQSRRMGSTNKLLATIDGKPLVRIAAEAALASRATPVLVVTGHQADAVAAAVAGLPVRLVHNSDYRQGLSTSLRTGIRALRAGIEGVVVMLADMPQVDATVVDRLIEAFRSHGHAEIVVPVSAGRRGNPVLWGAHFFAGLSAVSGDSGGRHLFEANPQSVIEVEMGAAVTRDVDTPAALAEAGGMPV